LNILVILGPEVQKNVNVDRIRASTMEPTQINAKPPGFQGWLFMDCGLIPDDIWKWADEKVRIGDCENGRSGYDLDIAKGRDYTQLLISAYEKWDQESGEDDFV